MDYDVALRLKSMKGERSRWFHCKASRFLFFFRTSFQRDYATIISNFFDSLNLIIQLILYLLKIAKITSKQCSSAISTSLFCWVKVFSILFICYSFVISFAYLTYHLTNNRTKLYIFSMLAVQNQHSNIKLTLRKVLF